MRAYRLEGETENGEKFELEVKNSHSRFVTHKIGKKLKYIELVPTESWGSEEMRVFGFEVE